MPKVVADITMSLDGFVTGPHPGPDNGLGDGGEALHAWVFSGDPVDDAVLRESAESPGAVVMGRRLFDVVDGPHGWTDETGYGGRYATNPAFVVVTHAAPERVRLDLDLTFATDGIAAAIGTAKAATGGKDVYVMGGGNVVRQCLDLGLADELKVHLAPVVLGSGTPLLRDARRARLVQREVRVSANATHLTYGVCTSS